MRKKTYKLKQNKSNKFRFSKHQTLGAPDAETDRNLDIVFVDIGVLEVLEDVDNSKCIIVGRTGSGKSALIRRIAQSRNNVTRIAPESMSLKFLTNSTILDYFRSLNIRLNFFYKVLWKHVFIVELLKLYLGESGEKRQNLLQNLWSRVSTGGKSDKTKEAALRYFEKWSDEFWLKTEHRIKTLENDLESKFNAETGININAIKSNLKAESTVNEKNTSEIKYKAEKIISDIQADDLVNLIEILSENVFHNSQKRYYIIIDDLDKDWVSQQIVYDLIGAMIEVIKEFQQIFIGVKIIIALRDNIYQIIFSGKEHRGGQREKYSPLFLNLRWDKNSLEELIDSRIKLLSNEQLNTENIFEKKSKHSVSGIDYILERTYLRPRDIISFFNKIIECSNNRAQLTTNLIKHAETPYSQERLYALEDEWAENYGDISKLYGFLFGIYNGFNLYNIKEDSFSNILFEINLKKTFKGTLLTICEKWKSSELKPKDFRKFLSELLFIFYKIGIIGIKRKPELKPEFFYNCEISLDAGDFDSDAKIYIHKSLFSALKINSKEQEEEYFGHS